MVIGEMLMSKRSFDPNFAKATSDKARTLRSRIAGC